MRYRLLFAAVLGTCISSPGMALDQRVQNANIDMPGFLDVAARASLHRESRRVSEQEFIRMRRIPGTIVLDARSTEKYAELHVKGALNLSFPDITVESLQRTIPDRATRILIYCNNNFVNADGPFPTKIPSAALNISTYITLYNYGYWNRFELGPLIDPRYSALESIPGANP